MRWTTLVAFLLALTVQATAQDPFDPFGAPQDADPFGAAPGQPSEGVGQDPFGGPAADPFAVQPKQPPAKPQPRPPGNGEERDRSRGIAISPDERDPAVLAIRDMNPTQPAELMFAVRALFDIGRVDEAKYFLIRLIEAQPDQQLLSQFHREYGEALFFRLSKDRRMAPEGAEFFRAVTQAANQSARDPDRIQGLINELNSPSPVRRARAVDSLRRLEYSVVTPLLQALADGSRTDEHPAIRSAIAQMGEHMIDPVLGALETNDTPLRIQVIRTLGQFRHSRVLGGIVGPFADPDSSDEIRSAAAQAISDVVGCLPARVHVERFLYDRARAYFEGMLPGRLDHEDRVTVWTWDAQQQTSVPVRLVAEDASLLFAARLSWDLHRIAPENVDYRRLALVTNLQWAKQQGGLDVPLDLSEGSRAARMAQVGVEALEDVLTYAMETRRPVAATAAVELLGRMGDASLVQSVGGRPRPLVTALLSGDRRLRVAAADAIVQLDPRRAYAGSSHLMEALGYVIRTVGTRRALVVHPRLGTAQSLAGLLLEMGFEADTATTGRDAFRLAVRHPDYEFALISDAVEQPAVHELIQMFRKDPRTSRLAIGLMGRQGTLESGEAFAETDELVLAFPQPLDAAGMTFQAGRLIRLAGRGLVGHDERLDQAVRAMSHLLRLTAQPEIYGFYDFHRQIHAYESALATPELAAQAAIVMGRLGSPDAQRALVTLASQHARTLADRQAAAEAFAKAVRRRGLLLTRDEILLQYDRYNRSEFLDAGTQQVLGQILDAIEAPHQTTKTQAEPEEQDSAAS
jgi:hypothetical protein